MRDRDAALSAARHGCVKRATAGWSAPHGAATLERSAHPTRAPNPTRSAPTAMPKRCIAALLLALLLFPRPALAWDAIGHEVIARIAWERMTPRARAAAAALLTHAPADAGLLQLRPARAPRAEADRAWFVEASTWADLVRDRDFPERQARYHRGPWHYVNYFFEETPAGPRDLPHLAPDTAHVVERLAELEQSVVDLQRPSAERAVDLAWILHMVGDLHQPLHTTARVTETEPRGDQGGNLFRLADDQPLHSYWDRAISREFPALPDETEQERVARIARTLMERHPAAGLRTGLEPSRYERWARAGFETAKAQVYRTPRGETPSAEYARATYATSERAAALAGYRLAELLNRVLGGERQE